MRKSLESEPSIPKVLVDLVLLNHYLIVTSILVPVIPEQNLEISERVCEEENLKKKSIKGVCNINSSKRKNTRNTIV